jgi:PAS domain S-box-containing protein
VIIPPERRDEERAILERLRRGEHVEHFDTVRVTKDGGRIDISLSVSPVFNASGQIIGAAKIARDVTSQKRAAAALRFSEERFRELANNIDQFAWTCTELGYTTWYNQRWYDYTGSTFEETRGDGWKSIHDPAHVDRVVARMKASVVTGEPWEDTFPLRGKDGRYRWFLSRAIPIRDERGHVVRWFGTNTDITEQRQLEQELRAADRRKDEFLATLAHELRNPLAPLRNALEILNLAGSDPDLIDEARSIMDRQLTHLVRLVDDLLDVSRITRDRLELRKSTVELNAAVEQAVSVQRSLMEELGLTIDVTPAAQPVHLSADPVRLTQILTNLLNNAVRYTSHGGRVSVIVERHGEQAIVTVRDTGIGIPSDQLENIFEMFTQAEESHHGAHVGLGIGLTLVKRLAELHGGHVEAHSEGLGMGSEFVVRLPGLSAPAEDKPAPANAERPHLASRRVLVVEDNVDSAATLEALLKIAGHETRVAHDGPEAVEQAEAFRPEVVLLDLGLPKMGGLEVCRWVRAQPWSERVTVVALTGWGQDTDRRRTSEAGFDDHLVKPVDPEKVLGLVASLPSRPAPVRSGAVH